MNRCLTLSDALLLVRLVNVERILDTYVAYMVIQLNYLNILFGDSLTQRHF